MIETLSQPMGELAYTTPAVLLGKHYWRCVVYPHPIYGACTEWLFLRKADSYHGARWQRSDRWPTHNSHDGETGGLPRSLRRIWSLYAGEIKAHLEQHPAPALTLEQRYCGA